MVGPWSSHRRAAGLVMGLAMGLAMGLVMARAGNAADREGADEVEAGVEAEDSMDSHGVPWPSRYGKPPTVTGLSRRRGLL